MVDFRWGRAFAAVLGGICVVGAASVALADDSNSGPEGYASTYTGAVPFAVDTTEAMAQRQPYFAPPAGVFTVPNVIPARFPGRHGAQFYTQPDLVDELFRGPLFPGPNENGWTPGDPEVAVGPTYAVGCINGMIAFYNKQTGGRTFWVDNANFFSGLGISLGMVFDPRCFYDQYSGRFFINYPAFSADGTTTYFAVACSDDSDPNGTWYKWLLNSTNNGGQTGTDWSDYPGMGYSPDVITWTANMYPNPNGYFYGKLRVAPKQQFLNGSPSITYTDFWDFGHASMQPGRHFGACNMPIVADVGGGAVHIIGIQNALTNPSLVYKQVGVQSWGGATGGVQPGTTAKVDTLDDRIYDVNVRDNSALVTHNISGGAGSQVRWYEVNCGSLPNSVSLTQQGNITASNTCCYYGGLQKNKNGDIGTGFTRSSSTEYVSLYYTGHASSDPAGTMRTPILKKASTVSYGSAGNTERWGDYCGAAIDPLDDSTFWTIGMLPVSSGGWTTEIYSYVLPGGAPQEVTYTAESVTPVVGSVYSGDYTGLWNVDTSYLDYMSGIVATFSTPGYPVHNVYGCEFYAQYDVGATNKLSGNVDFTGLSNNPANISIKILNVTNSRWDPVVSNAVIGNTEIALTGSIPGTASDHVSLTHKVKVKIVTNCPVLQQLNTNQLKLRMVIQ